MTLLSLLLATGLAAPPSTLLLPQEPPPSPQPEEESEREQEPPPKTEFDKLSGSQKRKAKKALSMLRGGRTEEGRAEAEEDLVELGEGVVPLLLADWAELVKAERDAELRRLLEALLQEDALHLCWPQEKEEAEMPVAGRRYLLRRWANSERKDAADFLRKHVGDKEGALAYEAARGLVLRGEIVGFDALAAWVQAHWTEDAAALRADFAGVERGPLSARAAQLANAQKRKDKLAGLHLYELFGVKEHAAMMMPALSESDTTLRLAAIDACRAVIDGEPPLDRPSMTAIIERAEKWKARIDQMQKDRIDQMPRERADGGAR